MTQPTEPRRAVTACLTTLGPGLNLINLSYGSPNVERTLITDAQLANIVADGSKRLRDIVQEGK